MNRFVKAEIISAALYAALAALLTASCTWMPGEMSDDADSARLTFHFARTKADAVPDTNDFILSVKQQGSDKALYEGLYGARPSEMKVPAGTYDIQVRSLRFDSPAFDSPLYGDEQVVVARSGETLAVRLICKQRNSGLRLAFSERFVARYPGKVLLRQDSGSLEYAYDERRTAWVFAGETRICYDDGKAENLLFRRNLQPGEIRSITLDASADESGSSFSIAVDTTAARSDEVVMVGGQAGGDGLSMATAYSVADLAASGCPGDTVWVWGYIVGSVVDEDKVDFACDTSGTGFTLAIAASPVESSPSQCAAVRLTKGVHKAALGLDDIANKANVYRRKLYVQGKTTTYKKFPALTNICDYRLE